MKPRNSEGESLETMARAVLDTLKDATKVNGWYAHLDSVKGPYCRWFEVTEVAEEYRQNVGTQVDDAKYAAACLTFAPSLAEAILLKAALSSAQPQPSPAGEFPEAEAYEAFSEWAKSQEEVSFAREWLHGARWAWSRAREMSSGGEDEQNWNKAFQAQVVIGAQLEEQIKSLKAELEQANAAMFANSDRAVKWKSESARLKEQLAQAQVDAAKYKTALELLIHEAREAFAENDSTRAKEAADEAEEALENT